MDNLLKNHKTIKLSEYIFASHWNWAEDCAINTVITVVMTILVHADLVYTKENCLLILANYNLLPLIYLQLDT